MPKRSASTINAGGGSIWAASARLAVAFSNCSSSEWGTSAGSSPAGAEVEAVVAAIAGAVAGVELPEGLGGVLRRRRWKIPSCVAASIVVAVVGGVDEAAGCTAGFAAVAVGWLVVAAGEATFCSRSRSHSSEAAR
nr:hypothetical protein [Granulicella arctica]